MTITKGYVDSTSGQVHYRETGSGEEVLVLLHQTAASSRMFESFMTATTAARPGMRLIALDTPGFGASDPWPTQPTTGELVDALAGAVDALGVGHHHLLGHHTGAALACEWAATRPGEVDSLTMIGALAMGAEARATWLAGVADAPVQADGSHLAAAWQRVAHIDTEPVAYPPGPELRHREAVDVLLATPRWPEAYRAVFSQDFESHLAAVTCPALLLCGRDDILWPYVDATLAVKPDLTSVALDGGAYVLDHSTDEVLAAVLEFLPR